jgi:hypothetical protein
MVSSKGMTKVYNLRKVGSKRTKWSLDRNAKSKERRCGSSTDGGRLKKREEKRHGAVDIGPIGVIVTADRENGVCGVR